jgi:hypothetical protein
VQLTKRTNIAFSVNQRESAFSSGGYLTGSWAAHDETALLKSKDLLGQIYITEVCLLSALVVSPLLPSGCAFPTISVLTTTNVPRRTVCKSALDPFALAFLMPLEGYHEDPLPTTEIRSLHRSTPRTVSYKQVVNDIQEAFALHTTDLADLLEVSRQAVHSWKSESGSEPGKSSVTKLLTLRDAASEWHDRFSPESPAWLLHSKIQGRTLKTWLSQVANGSTNIAEVMQKVTERLSAKKSPHDPSPQKPLQRERTDFEAYIANLRVRKSHDTDSES